MNSKEAYAQKLRAQIDIWEAEMSKLEARASKLEGDARIALQQQVKDLRANMEKVSNQMDELRRASDDAWQDIKGGIDGAWRNLENAVRSAVSRYDRTS